MEVKPLVCTCRPPTIVSLADNSKEFHSGRAYIDVTFPKVACVDIEEIHFKNYYTSSLSLLARKHVSVKESTSAENSEWKICLRSKILMPDAHCEQSSEDYFILKSSDLMFTLLGVTELRFILIQPSPVWKEFKIEEIQFYKSGGRLGHEVVLPPSWVSELGSKSKDEYGDRQLKGVSSVQDLSKQMQRLWALTELARANQTKTTLGRYDVDGCYDINLLSYN